MALLFDVNRTSVSVDADPGQPLLWVLRENLKLTGSKFGCGIGACGSCSVHVDGELVRSCVVSIGDVVGKSVVTIEGLSGDKAKLSDLQTAWIEHQVPQCGYCQSGQLMAAAALLRTNARPTDAQIDAAMTNLCRCATYPRIRSAIRAVIKGAK
jgi:isoquinoline 1-oxidoreductase subunit alpha